MAERRRQQSPGQRGGQSPQALDKSGDVIPEKLKENQRRLGVGEDHKTPEMKKGHRGTFP